MQGANTDCPQPTAIHRFVAQARAGDLPPVVARLRSGWVVLGDPQILPGYCLLLPDPVVDDLHALAPVARLQFLEDLGLLGQAVAELTGARRINYEMLGNVEPALHAHVIPRYDSEPESLRAKPVWLHDWDHAPRFDAVRDGDFMRRLRRKLEELDAMFDPQAPSDNAAHGESLREIPHVRQIAGEPRRRWFTARELDLTVWFEDNGDICSFQICGEGSAGQSALTWHRERGWFHARVGDGEDAPGRYKATPILIPNGQIDPHEFALRFRACSRGMEERVARFVLEKLESAAQV